MPCTLCGSERCTCISSVLDAIEPSAPTQHHAVVARLRPPAPAPPPPAPWPPPWVPVAPWRGGIAGVRSGVHRWDVLVAEHGIVLVPAGMSLERLLFFLGLLLGLITSIVGAYAGAHIDQHQGAQRLRALLGTPPEVVLGRSGSKAVMREQVEAVRVRTARRSASAVFVLRNGERLRLGWTRHPEAPALLQHALGADLVTVGPRPRWIGLLHGLAFGIVGLVLAAIIVFAVVATAQESRPASSSAGGNDYTTPEEMVQQHAHIACVSASNAFSSAPPERLGRELEGATRSMESVAAQDPRYQHAATALRWFLGHVRGGELVVSEAEAAPHHAALDAACGQHLAEEAEAEQHTF